MTIDPWLLEDKPPTSPSHASGMPRVTAVQRLIGVWPPGRNRGHFPETTQFERPDGNHHEATGTAPYQRSYRGNSSVDLKIP
jgi:hypothetical protein